MIIGDDDGGGDDVGTWHTIFFIPLMLKSYQVNIVNIVISVKYCVTSGKYQVNIVISVKVKDIVISGNGWRGSRSLPIYCTCCHLQVTNHLLFFSFLVTFGNLIFCLPASLRIFGNLQFQPP